MRIVCPRQFVKKDSIMVINSKLISYETAHTCTGSSKAGYVHLVRNIPGCLVFVGVIDER